MRSNKYIPRLYDNGGPGRRTHSAPINVSLTKQDPYDRWYQENYGGLPGWKRPAYGPGVGQGTRGNREIYVDRDGYQRYGGGYLVEGNYLPDRMSADKAMRDIAMSRNPSGPMDATVMDAPVLDPNGNLMSNNRSLEGMVNSNASTPQQIQQQQAQQQVQQQQQEQAQQQVQQQQAQQNSGPSQTRMSFNDAFKQARANGETEFPFNGKMYSTRYAEETPEQHMQSMMSAKGSTQPQVQSADPLFNDPSGSFPQNDPNLSSGFKFVPGQINPATGQPFTNQELAQSQAAAQQMNYIGDPEMLMAAMQRGEVDPSQLSRYGYKNIADLREEIRLRSERANMSETEQELKEFPGNRGFLRESEEDKLRREGITDIDKTVSDVSSVFERGNITEGVRSLINKGLTSQRGDKLNGFKAMSEDQANRMKNRLSRRGQRDQASAAVLSILDGRMEDVEGIIEALEDSKYDVTDVDALTLIDSTSGIRIDGSQQYVEDVFSGPGFTLTVTDDFVVGIVNGKEVKIPRG